MSPGFKSQSVGVRANLCDDRTVDIWSMYSRTVLDILFLIWGQTVADYKMLSFHLSINVIIIVVSFKILDLCPIALFQQLWNTLYLPPHLMHCLEMNSNFCGTLHFSQVVIACTINILCGVLWLSISIPFEWFWCDVHKSEKFNCPKQAIGNIKFLIRPNPVPFPWLGRQHLWRIVIFH